ncbi:helix-turn-helix domain-containing protein [Metabacillus fastidiosus]|uniref:helix-turn-helix domain-containing protein n=1 Tax=Metabacillus fastidiosus TaxID=1458 RepID=UPI003D2D570B
MSILGKRIKYLRERNNYSQKRVAEALGISNVQLSRYESGDRKPDPDMITAISDYFDVPADYLLGRSDNPDPSRKVIVAEQEITLSKEELDIFKEMKKYPTLFHDLANAPERKIKQLIKMWEIIKSDYEDDDENDDVIDDL